MNIFSLFFKELVSFASRRSTYIHRVLYGTILYILFFLLWKKYTGLGSRAIGSGVHIVVDIYSLNCIILLILLPIVSATSIVSEREKQTLPLLLICKIRPFSILFQKFLSTLIPITSLILISLPLVYMSYLLGGIQYLIIYIAIYSLFLFVLQVASIGIFFSCFCRSSLQAIIYTYGFLAVFYMFHPVYCIIRQKVNSILLFPPQLFFSKGNYLDFSTVFYDSLLVWKSIFVFLLLAILFFHRIVRDTTESKRTNNWESFKKALLFSYEKNIFITKPLHWREVEKKTINITFYLAILASWFVLYLFFQINIRGPYSFAIVQYYLYLVFFLGGTLIITIQSSMLFAKEYRNGTWNVILTTTMLDEEIFQQKKQAITRTSLMVTGFLIIAFLFYFYTEIKNIRQLTRPYTFLFFAISGIALVIGTIQWSSIWLGLRLQKNKKITLIATSIVVAWFLYPVFLSWFFSDKFYFSENHNNQGIGIIFSFISLLLIHSFFDIKSTCKHILQEQKKSLIAIIILLFIVIIIYICVNFKIYNIILKSIFVLLTIVTILLYLITKSLQDTLKHKLSLLFVTLFFLAIFIFLNIKNPLFFLMSASPTIIVAAILDFKISGYSGVIDGFLILNLNFVAMFFFFYLSCKRDAKKYIRY